MLDDWLDGVDDKPDAELRKLARTGCRCPAWTSAATSARDGHGARHGPRRDGRQSVRRRLARRARRYVALAHEEPLSGTLPALGDLLVAKQLDAGDMQYPLYLINGRPPGDPYSLR